MNLKRCRGCKALMPLSAFYRHGQMADGHLNKCKDCVKARVRRHRQSNESVREYDRMRTRSKDRKDHIRRNADRWRDEHPEKYRAHYAVSNAVRDGKLTKQPCEVCGDAKVHAHHEDYSRPLDVRWLCPRHHAAELKVSDPMRLKIRAA